MPLFSDGHITDEQFKSALENYSVKPSGKVWWRLAHALNLKQKKSSTRRVLILAGIFILLSSSAGLLEVIYQAKSSSSKTSEIIESPASGSVSSPSVSNNQIIAETGNKESWIKPARNTVPCAGANGYLSEQEKDLFEKNQVAIMEYPSVLSNDFIAMMPGHSLKYCTSLTPVEKIRNPKSSDAARNIEPAARSYYFGVSASFNNTWLLDDEAIRSNNLKYTPTFGIAYGMQGGFNFSKHWGMQGAWILNSWQGQHYKNLDLYGRTTDLDYNQKSISLTYIQLPILVQYKIPLYSEILNIPVCLNFIFGGQYGRLISFRIDDTKGELQNNNVFRKTDYSAVAGFDYDFFVKKPVF